MIYEDIAKNIIDLKNADLALRDKLIQRGELGEGYNEEMRALHNKNARVLNEIIDLADRLRRLAPSSRNPERFHEEKSEIVHALRLIAREVAR